MSSDGMKMRASQQADAKGGYGQLYLNANYGLIGHRPMHPGRVILSVVIRRRHTSGSGAVSWDLSEPGRLFTTTDSGLQWAVSSNLMGSWSAVASSSDGSKLVAAQAADASGILVRIYISADRGMTWTVAFG